MLCAHHTNLVIWLNLMKPLAAMPVFRWSLLWTVVDNALGMGRLAVEASPHARSGLTMFSL